MADSQFRDSYPSTGADDLRDILGALWEFLGEEGSDRVTFCSHRSQPFSSRNLEEVDRSNEGG